MYETLIASWALAALSYDEDKVADHIRELFPEMCLHFKSTKNGCHFYGVAMDDRSGTIYIVNRGTDGYTPAGNFRSWMRNLRLLTGEDGVHNGFQEAGNRVIDDFKMYLYKYETCVVCGHSQGAGVAQYELCLLAEYFPNLKTIHGDIFAAPPAFDNVGKARFDAHVADGRLSLDRYVTKGDPIDSNILRNPRSFLLGGCDVGREIELPTIIGYDLKIANVVKHSTRVYNAGLMQMCAADWSYKDADLRMLGMIGERIVN